jgi:hypothetical protein
MTFPPRFVGLHRGTRSDPDGPVTGQPALSDGAVDEMQDDANQDQERDRNKQRLHDEASPLKVDED